MTYREAIDIINEYIVDITMADGKQLMKIKSFNDAINLSLKVLEEKDKEDKIHKSIMKFIEEKQVFQLPYIQQMREATKEEVEGIHSYIMSIDEPTTINMNDLLEQDNQNVYGGTELQWWKEKGDE